MTVAVLSDTHLTRASKRGLPEPALSLLATSDVILHAGDVTDTPLLDSLRAIAPLHVVLGNNDTGLHLPETIEITLDGVRVAMIHDSGDRIGRERRMKKRFPNADVVVFGHSHIPWNENGVDGQLLFNPGSPTQRRSQPFPTMGVLEFDAGQIVRQEIVRVD